MSRTVAISIDQAASGLLPHRFVRAVSASTLVLIAATAIGLLATTIVSEQLNGAEDIAELTAGVVIVGIGFALLFALLISVIGSLFDALPHQLVGFVMLVVNGGVAFASLVVAGFRALQTLGVVPTDPNATVYADWQNWSMVAMLALAGLIAFEGARWALWQMRADRLEFFAVRGWRSPPWRLFSALRQRLGLPAFISNFGRGRMSLTLVYFLAAILNIGLVALLIAPFFVFSIERGGANAAPLLAWAGGFVGLVVLNAIGLGAVLQNIAAARATKLYQDAREWDGRPPIVFLRAFNQDASKLKARTRDPLVKFPAGCGEARTLDELLLEHATVYGPVIAIGDPRDPTPPLGAARVFVKGEGDEWQGVVTSLVGAASAVVMCPSTSEGVKWEIDLIAEAQGRVRVILLANPELSPEQTIALFERFAPGAPALAPGQTPIAAWPDPADRRRWAVLTTSRPPCVQTYTIALNMALQDQLGMKAVPVTRPRRRA